VNLADLEPRRHGPPAGWDREVFERVTDALALTLVAAVRRHAKEQGAVRESER
jgi:hypothetical protein